MTTEVALIKKIIQKTFGNSGKGIHVRMRRARNYLFSGDKLIIDCTQAQTEMLLKALCDNVRECRIQMYGTIASKTADADVAIIRDVDTGEWIQPYSTMLDFIFVREDYAH